MKHFKAFFIRIVGNKKRENLDVKKVNKILIGGGRVGDVIVKTPMLKALKKSMPKSEIHLVLHPTAVDLVKYNPYVDKIIPENICSSKNRLIKTVHQLREAFRIRKKYDLVFDFKNTVNFFHLLSLKIMASRYVVGRYRKEKYGIKKDELTLIDRYASPDSEHAVDINLDFLNPLGIIQIDRAYEIFIDEEREKKYKHYFDKNKVNIIFNFKGSSEKKSLDEKSIEYFLRKVPEIGENIGLHLLTIPSMHEEMKKKIENWGIKKVKLLPKTESILDAAALVKNSDMLLSVDTGIIHVACAFDKPILGIYPNDPNTLSLFRPITEKFELVISPDYTGTSIAGFSKEEVMKKLADMLKEMQK